MPAPGLADQQELLRWADSIGSRSDLPRLIRKLILETGSGVVQLGFPAGAGVAAGGWDGTARATESTAFVPEGLSLWELSVEKSVGKKVDSDYVKRTTTPDGSTTSNCAYIAVSLRRFAKRSEWAETRSKEGRWREVRALGVDDLETWLEEAPVTHAWLSELLGLGPYGIRAGDSWWQDWSSATDPPMTPEVVLAGRSKAVTALHERFQGAASVTTIKGGSVEEIQAFVSAVGVRASNLSHDQMLARLALVDDIRSWRALRDHKQPLVLIAATPDVQAELSIASKHHVVVPVLAAPSADIALPPVEPSEAEAALKAAGINDDRQADRSARLARRSFLALRRSLAVKPELHTPSWAQPPGDRLVRGVLLAGRWAGRNSSDVEIIQDLLGRRDDDLREALDGLAVEQDPLITRIDESWALASPFDAWLQLRGQLGEVDLKRLESAVRKVLLEVDPALDLPPEEQWMASVKGKVRDYSGSLRAGLATSLTLLGVNGDSVDHGRGRSFASYLVSCILDEANQDVAGQMWNSLAGLLPLFMEAAPGTFADAVRAGLQGDDPVLARVFTDAKGRDSLFSSSSPHTGLLWALEGLAWSTDYFGQAVDLLARLEEIDPGGQLVNRPSNSLAEIFCPWCPENAVTNRERLAAIDGLRKRHPDVAWRLMQSMLPEHHGVHSPTHEPEFRDWKPAQRSTSNAEYFELVEAVAHRVVEDAATAGGRWSALLESGSSLPSVWKIIREGLEERVDDLSNDEQEVLWKSLRRYIARHREFSDTDWALPESELDRLDKVEQSISPKEAKAIHEWLFAEHSPDLGWGGKGDYSKYQEELDEHRKNAVAAVEREDGLAGVLATAKASPIPGDVGWALANATGDRHEAAVTALSGSAESYESAVAFGYLSRRFRQAGWEWLVDLLNGDMNLSSTVQGRILVNTRDYPKAWEIAEERGAEVDRNFWQNFSPYGLGADYPHAQFTAEKLLSVQRPAASMKLLELYVRHEDEGGDAGTLAPAMADALDAILEVQKSDAEFGGLSEYDFQRAFQYLEKHKEALGVDRVARLEWAYLPALGIEPDVPALHDALAQDPEFFLQIITSIYRPHSGEDLPPPTPHEETVAQNGYRLLSSWKKVPGMGADGQIDGDAMRAWVATARKNLEEADRLEVGEINIGHVLSHAPVDADGSWPAEPVRELLEELQSERIEDGLSTQIFNNRGTTVRLPEAGGDQERDLAKQYRGWGSQFSGRWPRIAVVLRGLADTYESQARQVDSEAEYRRRGLG